MVLRPPAAPLASAAGPPCCGGGGGVVGIALVLQVQAQALSGKWGEGENFREAHMKNAKKYIGATRKGRKRETK